MLVGIHKAQYGIIDDISIKFKKILEHNNIPYVLLDINKLDFWEQVKKVDLFIYMWKHEDYYKRLAKTILPIIENHLKIKCLPNQDTCWHYDDKIKQYYLLKNHGFPVVDSWVFWDKKEALSWIKYAKFPLVFKLAGGAGSSNVILLKNKNQAISLIKRMFGKGIITSKIPGFGTIRYKYFNPYKEMRHFARKIKNLIEGKYPSPFWQINKDYVYFQKFLPNNTYDTRVTTIGNRIYAFRRFVRENDFRASGSDNWSLDRSQIDMNLVKLGYEISKTMNFQVMAYDFIYDENKEPKVVEISYTYGDYPEFSNGYWDPQLNWHSGSYWTQYLELIDALNMPNLKQPYIKPTGHYAEVLKK